MRTDQLIAALAADPPRPARPLSGGLLSACALAAAAAALVFAATIGFRPGLAAALGEPAVLFKLLFAATCAVCAFALCTAASRPEASRSVALALAPPAVVLVAGVAAELALTPAGAWRDAVLGSQPLACLALIAALSAAPVAAALTRLRSGAPRSPALAGAAAGILGGGLGALVFALHCPNDSALFVATWYGAALLVLAGAGAALGRRVLDW